MLALEESLYSNFIDSLKSPVTKHVYSSELKRFMKFHRLESYSDLMTPPREERIKEYIIYLAEKHASVSKFTIVFSALKNFYEMNDVEDIKWKKLKRFMGEEKPEIESRRYTHEEISILLNNADLKLKAAILIMASSGIRVGALPLLTLSDITALQVTVYRNSTSKYITFITPEARKALDNYLQFRERCGEKLTPESPLIRKDFDTELIHSAHFDVHPLTKKGLNTALARVRIRSGLAQVDHTKYVRKEVKLTHGFRYFFETMLVNTGLQETVIRKLMGHSSKGNLTQLYSKQTEEEMLLEYEKAIDALTINPENRLKRKVEKLEVEKTKIESLGLELEKIKKAIKIK